SPPTRRTTSPRGAIPTSTSHDTEPSGAGLPHSCTRTSPIDCPTERRSRNIRNRCRRSRKALPTRTGTECQMPSTRSPSISTTTESPTHRRMGTTTETASRTMDSPQAPTTGSTPRSRTPSRPPTPDVRSACISVRTIDLSSSETTWPGSSSTSTTVVPAFALLTSSFKVSSANTPLSVPWQQVGPQPTATLIDPNSNAATTVYNQQRKVVRAGFGAGPTPCDATNSAGCWYTVFY